MKRSIVTIQRREDLEVEKFLNTLASQIQKSCKQTVFDVLSEYAEAHFNQVRPETEPKEVVVVQEKKNLLQERKSNKELTIYVENKLNLTPKHDENKKLNQI